MFNEIHSMVMIMTVIPEEKVDTVLAGVIPMFERHSGVVFISDVTVVRRDYFQTSRWLSGPHTPNQTLGWLEHQQLKVETRVFIMQGRVARL